LIKTAKGFNIFEIKATQTIKPSLFKGITLKRLRTMQQLKKHSFTEVTKIRSALNIPC